MSRLLPAALLTAIALVLPARVLAGPVDAQRAVQAYAAMQQYLYDPASGEYLWAVGASPGVEAWPDSQALGAAIAVAGLPGAVPSALDDARRALAGLGRFRRGSLYTSVPGSAVYWDDDEWIAEDFLDWHAFAGGRSSLQGAVNVFAAAVSRAWDGNLDHPCPGGVVWTESQSNGDRNTVSTANGALVGLRLYELTHRRVFLAWSQRMLGWLDRCLLAPDGLYWDHVRADGTIDRSLWSYNQGTVLDAYVEIYRTTGDATALARAEGVADASLAYFAGRLACEPPVFTAIFFRDLLQLAAVDGRQAYVDAAEAYATQMWQSRRDPTTGLFSGGGEGPDLLTQASLVRLYAALAGT